MPADSLHVTQMKGFEPPSSAEVVNTPTSMRLHADKAAAKAEKAEDTDSEQSSPDAAAAEQEN